MPECAVPGCGWPIRTGRLMCAGHWRRVPRPLQQEVSRAYQERVAALSSPGYVAARDHHEALKRDAVAAVTGGR